MKLVFNGLTVIIPDLPTPGAPTNLPTPGAPTKLMYIDLSADLTAYVVPGGRVVIMPITMEGQQLPPNYPPPVIIRE
jgi:hypothetical protein